MPTKRKFSAKFPTARIKKIMQLDEDVGKVAATVPPVVSRAMELMVEQLLGAALSQAKLRNSKTVTASHLKFVIESDPCLAFARKLVSTVADLKAVEEVVPTRSNVLTGLECDNSFDQQSTTSGRGRGRRRGRGRGRGGNSADKSDRPKKERSSRGGRRRDCDINREVIRSQSAEERLIEDQKLNGLGNKEEEAEEVSPPRKRFRKSVTISVESDASKPSNSALGADINSDTHSVETESDNGEYNGIKIEGCEEEEMKDAVYHKENEKEETPCKEEKETEVMEAGGRNINMTLNKESENEKMESTHNGHTKMEPSNDGAVKEEPLNDGTSKEEFTDVKNLEGMKAEIPKEIPKD